jgi:predicted Zn-dependent peptidase
MAFDQHKLANGLQVIGERNDDVHSVAFGFFVKTGSRDETPDVSGVSHFLEHMVFKGTPEYSAEDVNRIFDEIGAKYNASTSEEVTLFYAAVLPEYVPRAFGLLAAILRPSLRDEDFDLEKQVILEEIGMYDDMPTFLAYEKSMGVHFLKHPLGNSILGTSESIMALSAEQMRSYHDERYNAPNITLAVSGKFDWSQIVDLAGQHCADWPDGECSRETFEAHPEQSVALYCRESNQQQHMMQLASGPAAQSDLRYAADLLSVIVGDDSGSRMYWELVDPGYAEAAELGFNEYDGAGTWLTYLSCAPEQTQENLERIAGLYQSVNADAISNVEIEQARGKVLSRIVLRSERPMGRLSSLGSNWVYRDEYRSVTDDLEAYRQLTPADIRDLLDQYPLAQVTTVGVGPLSTL